MGNVNEILTELRAIQREAQKEFQSASNHIELSQIKAKYLGRQSALARLLKQLSDLSQEERPQAGSAINRLKEELNELYEKAGLKIKKDAQLRILEKERVDITLPGRRQSYGRKHPLTQITEEIKHIFQGMGFSIAEGPEVEFDYYNFEALNFPKDHPARDMQDTFYISEDIVLRTHTSPVQIRVMEAQKPPVRVIVPGKVYRHDSDITHSPMFHQVEGLLVDEGVSLGDLKGTLEVFVHRMFGKETRLRFRASFFPFTEPSAEVDISCVICKGRGCRVCSHTGWLEILGCGMVDPAVFKMVNYDSEKYTGFAFGMGVERIAMLKYGIDDIRLFFENDLRFLKQF